MSETADLKFMEEALREAQKALNKGEVPVGAVIAQAGVIIGRGHNSKEKGHDPSAHAEMLAIRSAAKKLKGWRISHSTLYVTLEPCLMCMGALIQARLPRLVFAAFDPKAGACGSLYDVSNDKRLNHRLDVTSGVSAQKAGALLKGFFKALRDRKKTV